MIFIAAEVAELSRVLQGKFQWFQRMIKTHEPDLTRDVPRGAQDGEGVGRRTQTDIPDHKFTGMMLQSFAKPELIDIKRLRLRDRPDDRMKGFSVRERAHGTDAVVQTDKLVA